MTLHIGHNNLRRDGLRHLSSLTNITALELKNNDIVGEEARHLASLTNLKTLGISHNKLGHGC